MGNAQRNIRQAMSQTLRDLTVKLIECMLFYFMCKNIKKFSPEMCCNSSLYVPLYGSWQYTPNTVVVKRCAGACLHQLSCIPTEKQMVPFSVSITGLRSMADYGISGVEAMDSTVTVTGITYENWLNL
jgi:hypothetical protein